MDKIWHDLYKMAKSKINALSISEFIEYGNNVCAILGSNNKIYCGISITSNTNINCSAEKSAITLMINDNEKRIKRIVILNELEEVIAPSEESLEYLLELCENPNDIEVLIDYDKGIVKKLPQILPDWWGTYRNKKN